MFFSKIVLKKALDLFYFYINISIRLLITTQKLAGILFEIALDCF